MGIEVRERLPDWTNDGFERFRMNQLTQILERRFLSIEEALIDIDMATVGSGGGGAPGGEYAALVHTHGVTEITDYPADNLTVSNFPANISLGDLGDVDLSGLANEYIIKYSTSAFGGSGGWIVDDIASAGNSLASLIDVQLSTLSDGDLLEYDTTTARWISVSAAGLPFIRKAGDIVTGNIQFQDTIYLAFGSGNDARMFWDGANMINRLDSGSWFLQVNNTETAIEAAPNSYVQLYYDGAAVARTGANTFQVFRGGLWEDVVDDTLTLDVIGTADEVEISPASGPLDLSTDRAWTIGLADDPILPGVGSARVPSGTTAQEPSFGIGRIRFDTDLNTLRFSDSGAWRTPAYAGGAFHDGFSDFVADEHVDHSGVTVSLSGDTNEISISGAAQDLTSNLSFSIGLSDDAVFPGVAAVRLPNGTTAQQPTPANGMLRYDTDTGKLRAVEGGAWADVIGAGGGATALNDLTDVTITSAAIGQTLAYDGTSAWTNRNNLLVGEFTGDGFRAAYQGAASPTDGPSIDLSSTGEIGLGDIGNTDDVYIQFKSWSSYPSFGTLLSSIGHFASNELQIRAAGASTSISLRSAGGSETLALFTGNGAASLFYNNLQRLITTPTGADVTTASGTMTLRAVTSATSAARIIAQNSVAGAGIRADISTGNMTIGQYNASSAFEEAWITGARNGAVTLNYDGTARLYTQSAGAEVIGGLFSNVSTGTVVRLRMYGTAGGLDFLSDTSGHFTLNQLSAAGALEDVWMSFTRNAGVFLRYDNVAKFVTTNAGADVLGTTTTTFRAVTTGTALVGLQAQNSVGGVTLRANATTGDMAVGQLSNSGAFEENWIAGVRNGGVSIYYNGATHLRTSANGIDLIPGNDVSPSAAGVGQISITGNGYNGFIAMNATGMYIGQNSGSRNIIIWNDEKISARFIPSGASELYYNDTLSFRTTAAGQSETYSAATSAVHQVNLNGVGQGRIYKANLGTYVEDIQSSSSSLYLGAYDGTSVIHGLRLSASGGAPLLGLLGATPITRPAVTGSRSGGAALTNLLTALANLGAITDSTSA